MLSGRGLCDELFTRPEESYRLWCVVVCDLETSRIGTPYVYDISSLRVNFNLTSWSGFIYGKLIVRLVVQKYPAFYGTQVLLSCLFEPATFPCPEPD